jgi:hypothetical protein
LLYGVVVLIFIKFTLVFNHLYFLRSHFLNRLSSDPPSHFSLLEKIWLVAINGVAKVFKFYQSPGLPVSVFCEKDRLGYRLLFKIVDMFNLLHHNFLLNTLDIFLLHFCVGLGPKD